MPKTRYVTLDGECRPLAAWARTLDISSTGLARRIRVWGLRRALTTPKGHQAGGHRRLADAIAEYYAAHPEAIPPWEKATTP